MSIPVNARVTLRAFAMICFPLVAFAQSVESDLTPEAEALVRDASHYALPDIGDTTLDSTQIIDHKDRFSVKLGLALLPMDYTSFDQDAASKAQVGNERDQFEARSLRLMLRGHFELWRRWDYVASYEYKGFANEPGDPDWSASDLNIATDIGRLGRLKIGKFKEPYAYELAGDSANLPHNERLLSPFFTSRNVGVQWSNTMLDQRGTWAVGWYNDWWVNGDSFGESGNDFAARVTALPVWTEDSSRYLHVAALAGDHAWNTGLELLWNVEGIWEISSVSSQATGDPHFQGYYLTAGWVVTGEHRPYDRKAGYARRVLPQGRWGAWEIVGRFGHVDLDDKGAHGGTMDGWWAGVNWWATRRWKASIGYGDIDLDRLGLQGNTKTLLTRIQWIY